jgi:hypothetical protein
MTRLANFADGFTSENEGDLETLATEQTLFAIGELINELKNLVSTNAKQDELINAIETIQINGMATEETLGALLLLAEELSVDAAKEETLESINGKDFATEATLNAISTILSVINGKDFATQTTLAALNSKDFATAAKQDAAITELQDIEAAVKAVMTPSYQELLNITTSAQTITAPTNAKWCKIQADDTNSATLRVKIGGAATVSSGIQFQPGRSEDYSAVGNISVIAESGTGNKIYVQFGV